MATQTTGGGSTTSFLNAPQAQDDYTSAYEDYVFCFDVMSNDLGGAAKILWSIDDTAMKDDSFTGTYDLLTQDTSASVPEYSDMGAKIRIVNGKIQYDTNSIDFLGEGQTAVDTFTYAIRLANGTLSWATVYVTITGRNDGPAIVAATDVDGDITEDGLPTQTAGSFTFSDVDLIDTHSVTVTPDDSGYLGSLNAIVSNDSTTDGSGQVNWRFVVDNAAIQYLAVGETVTQTYTVTVDDGHGGTAEQVVTIEIHGTNDGPDITVKAGDSASAGLNESDAGLTVSGTLSITDFDTSDVVDTVVSTVSVSGTGGAGSLTEAQLKAMLSLTVGFEDNAADGTAGSLGWAFDSGSEAFDFLGAGETLILTYTLTASDGHTGSDTQTVTITITGTNDAPVAVDDSNSGDEDAGAIAGSVAGNDSDVDNAADDLSYILVDDVDASEGVLTFNADGSYSFVPAADFFGEVTFTYKANDGDLDSNVATVTITVNPVNDAPVAVDDSNSGDEDAGAIAGSVAGNDSDVDNAADDLSYILVDDVDASEGVLTFNADGSYSFVPAADFFGEVTFTYKANDGDLDSNVATVTITVNPVNDAPVAVDDSNSGDEDAGAIAGSVAGNDSDVDNAADDLSYILVDDVDASEGVLTFNADGSYSFVPAADFFGEVTFTYKANDGDLDSNVATVTITVNPVNDAPTDVLAPTDIKFALAASTGALTGTNIAANSVLGTFTAVDGDSATWTFALGGTNASLFALVPSSGGSVTFQVSNAALIPGNYTFSVTATDSGGNSHVETYTLSVGTTGGDAAAIFTVTNGTDISFGMNGTDSIQGGGGDDAIVGGQNVDTIFGGLGNDQLIGGGQNDLFAFDTAPNGTTNSDKILDFDAGGSGGPGGDKIQLDDDIFTSLTIGTLLAANFAANAGGNAADGNDFVLFDTNTGKLYYDADGNGAGVRVEIATITLVGGSTIDSTDFVVIA